MGDKRRSRQILDAERTSALSVRLRQALHPVAEPLLAAGTQSRDVIPYLGFCRRVEILQVSLEDPVNGVGVERRESEGLEQRRGPDGVLVARRRERAFGGRDLGIDAG